jgi:hypothetical protein
MAPRNVILLAVVLVIILIMVFLGAFESFQSLKIWVGALLTLMVFSFLYQDNPFYKFAEHLFVGVSAAYWMTKGIQTTLWPNCIRPVLQDWFQGGAASAGADHLPFGVLPFGVARVIPAVFGLILLTRLIGPIGWFSRWAMAFIIGFAAGTNFTRYLQSDFVGQIYNTLLPMVTGSSELIVFVIYAVIGAVLFLLFRYVISGLQRGVGAVTFRSLYWFVTVVFILLFATRFPNFTVVVGVTCGLIYFFFSVEHKGAFGWTSQVGIYVLMLAFGATFGYTVMARISLLIGRMSDLGVWLGSIF